MKFMLISSPNQQIFPKMRKLIIHLAFLFGIVSSIYGKIVQEINPVTFDPEFGGLHAKDVVFNVNDQGTNRQKFDVMLSTVNPMTFLIDKNDCPDAENFCLTHKNKYDDSPKEGQGNTRKGESKKMEDNDLKGMGKIVVDIIQFGALDINLKIDNSQFGLMNHKAETDPRFWGIKRSDGKVEKENKAEGCLSLSMDKPKYETDFNGKTPMQTLVGSDLLWQQIVSIQLDKLDQVPDNTSANGYIVFGALAVNEQCHNWNMASGNTTNAWNVQIEALEGVEELKDKNAIIDTSNEQITVPKDAWKKLNELIKEGECNSTKLKPLKFTIGGFVYSIPTAHYLKLNKDSCIRLLAQNSDETDQNVHLGLPFIRSTCVATDLKSKEVFLSEGFKKKGGGGDNPPSPTDDGKKNAAIGGLASSSIIMIAFAIFAFTAIIIY